MNAPIKADITVHVHGSIWILYGLTDAGKQWLTEHLGADGPRWGQGWVVEPRFAADIIRGAEDDGLVVR